MVDSNPNDHTAHSTSPAARLATRDELYGTDAPSCIPDQDQIDAVLGFSPDAPAASLSAEDIKAMRGRLAARKAATDKYIYQQLSAEIAMDMPRLLGALEALTAERDRLADLLNAKQSALDIVWSENARMNQIERAAAEYVETAVALTRPHTDMERTRAAFRNQPAAIQRLIAAVEGYADRDWYASHRRRVEAAHAAAKQAKREAECRNCSDGFPAYASWPDGHICPFCGRNCDAAAKEAQREADMQELADLGQALQPESYAAGIDMELLGRLCREEPDEAAKREVEAMMDGIRAPNDSPLSDPGYPELVKMARESAKGGD